MPGGQPRVIFSFIFGGGKITGIGLVADPGRLSQIELVVLEESASGGMTGR